MNLNWEIVAAFVVLAIIVTILAVQFWNKRKTAKAGASSLLGKVEAAVGGVESLFAGASHVPPRPLPARPAQEDATQAAPAAAPVAPVTSSDPVAAAHAALDATIAAAQATIDAAKAKKDALTKSVTDAVAAAK